MPNLAALDVYIPDLCRDSFAFFKAFIWRRYIRAAHLTLLDKKLEAVTRYVETGGAEGIGQLLIEMPPRHGKTQSISRLFPAWFLGRNPDRRVILTSYGASLAEQNSRYVRSIIRSQRFSYAFHGIQLSQDSKARDAWNLAAPYEGGLIAVGKAGAVTGKGADLIINDDPVKNRAEAESELQRDKDWAWWINDLMTRREPSAAVISVMTRWHFDDLHGRLRNYESDQWDSVRLPALAEENDPLGRPIGAALWPSRFSREDLLKMAKVDYTFNSLYQQNPMPPSGGLFKREKFRIIQDPPMNIRRYVMYWDLALSEKTSADYTVGCLLGETSNREFIILEIVRLQVDWDELPDHIEKVILRLPEKVVHGIESNFYHGRAVKKLLQRPSLHRHTIRSVLVETDKFTRALPVAGRVGEGVVYCLNRVWTEDLIRELTVFPKGPHDDQVDAVAGAYLMLDDKGLQAERKRYA